MQIHFVLANIVRGGRANNRTMKEVAVEPAGDTDVVVLKKRRHNYLDHEFGSQKEKFTPAGNRTRASTLATLNSTTELLV